ncbi:type II restriction enzyme [Acidovorax sp. NO-1]|uniref:BREX-1 system adenine-specific DNA-methyltransferase PglX n=1 Tax=Acidovorax sp. NO-1 TaxID=512030 RepID=UPI00023FD3C8|nr:BREX-1 system adenine-specific DNA-methyltransferase PglX [Acidovorax sp. NO-1]EHL20860.1 type II restriction enzyme [Acidovorax sp. NO-1]
MNKSNLKSYAPQARKDFIAAVTARANLLGLSDKVGTLEVAPAQTQGDVTVIAGQAWPAKVNAQRNKLIERIRKDGFAHTMEAVAYTWFNRFAALRYMELHDYLGHGHRALSSTSGGLPDILTHATDLTSELPGLNAVRVTELKLAGNRDGELYRMLLVAQCNALSRAMPFLFERIDDDSELLLPDNLLRSDSVIAKLVAEIPEEDWAEVEIIGWLYQFYISEKKDQVIGKVVKSEDIPAATQLFTPNWIVQYLVQNSVGRLWLMANPQSTLAKEWPYYITPAEQTPEVQAQLDALIQTRVREDGDTLNPESITVLDPACGSGHILVVAYDVLKAIYLERGYQPRAIPRLILEKNLYGLDIDDRAAQMAGFALLMKARADDRRLFTATDNAGNLQPPKLNVLSLQESKGLSVDELATHLAPFKVQRATIAALVETFEHAKTFGSLIQIPHALKTHLAVLPEAMTSAKHSEDMYASAAADDLLPLVQQAQVLTMQFDAVVANPPYMGGRNGMNDALKSFSEANFPSGKADIYAAFIDRGMVALRPGHGSLAFITMEGWMFLPSFEELRKKIQKESSIATLLHLGPRAFETISGEIVRVVAFTVTQKSLAGDGVIDCFRLVKPKTETEKRDAFLSERSSIKFVQKNFSRIPEGRMAYWLSPSVIACFDKGRNIESIAPVRQGFQTGNNDKFMRFWYEISQSKMMFDASCKEDVFSSGRKWVPYNKGGEFRKWFGNNDYVVAFDKKNYETLAISGNCLPSRNFYFQQGITWSAMGGTFGARLSPKGFTFSAKGASAFPSAVDSPLVLSLLNSKVANAMFEFLAPTLDFNVGAIRLIPIPDLSTDSIAEIGKRVQALISIAESEWDSSETSWNFKCPELIRDRLASARLAWEALQDRRCAEIRQADQLTSEVDSFLIAAYGLGEESSLAGSKSDFAYLAPVEATQTEKLISYAIGCMMGRYSLDEPGLIYAHAGNVGFEPARYATFPADADGIVPITDELWFADDAPSRIREFLRAVWGPDTLEENMAWLAESLGTKASETPDETIRRYIADKFFKDHLQTYKKRPIYWLFSSGKQGAFQALVYLHRYHEGTLARLRAEYVVPLTGKIQSRIEMLQKDAAAASSTTARNKLNKEIEKLTKKHAELLAYDEKLRHYADMRIKLDLDDGVKVNYGKFGDLLEGVKIVTGGSSDD